MQKGLKIFVGIIAMLGLLSTIFLFTSKKKPEALPVKKFLVDRQQSQSKTSTQAVKAVATTPKPQNQKAVVSLQWQKCKNKTMESDTKLFWNVQIFEGIPAGGTYAKGYLESDQLLPVRVIIKPDSQITEKINQMLVVGKVAHLRANCIDVADGSVMLQAF